jgi:hypothetical protein
MITAVTTAAPAAMTMPTIQSTAVLACMNGLLNIIDVSLVSNDTSIVARSELTVNLLCSTVLVQLNRNRLVHDEKVKRSCIRLCRKTLNNCNSKKDASFITFGYMR